MRAALALVVALGACDAASSEPGLDALLQIEGAQYRPGPFPDDEGGPAAIEVAPAFGRIAIGAFDGQLRGTLERGARAQIIGVVGVDGAWILPAALPQLDTPDLPSVEARFGLAADFPSGPFEVIVAAGDAEGRVGAPATTTIVAEEVPPPDGELVIGLYWDSAADLDLHVTDALGGTAWSGDPNTYEPPGPGEPPDPPGAHLAGGMLDRDGNRGCRRDAVPREHVIWAQPPPVGAYVVRVNLRSLCGDAAAYWHVVALRRGEVIGAARGVSAADDVTPMPAATSGIRTLDLEVTP